jgi:PAT family beta-lactamase induction signal transducer AmpG
VSTEREPAVERPRRWWNSAHAWVTTTYFAEGFPYAVVNNLAEYLFKELGASLQAIGLTAAFHLPWNLKFLWGPFLDEFETKRRWLLGTEIVLAVLLLILALVASSAAMLGAISVCFLVMAVFSATHDIAIDGYYLEGLDERGQSKYVGYRAAAYKLASATVRGPLFIFIGYVGWRVGLLTAAALLGGLALFHAVALPRVERRQKSIAALPRLLWSNPWLTAAALAAIAIVVWRDHLTPEGLGDTPRAWIASVPWLAGISVSGWIGLALLAMLLAMLAALPWLRRRMDRSDSDYARSFVDFLAQPQVGRILAFVMLFRTGESFLEKMRLPFMMDVARLSGPEYGWLNGTVGLLAVFVATILGGRLIARDGLRRWIWPFVLAQNVLNLSYAVLALADDPATVGPWGLGAVIVAEHFGAGLGTAVFMVYLMRVCDPAHKAAHMALLTALMSVGYTVAGIASGFLATALGYAPFFVLTFFATLPMMALIPYVPHLDPRPSPPSDEGAADARS